MSRYLKIILEKFYSCQKQYHTGQQENYYDQYKSIVSSPYDLAFFRIAVGTLLKIDADLFLFGLVVFRFHSTLFGVNNRKDLGIVTVALGIFVNMYPKLTAQAFWKQVTV